MQTFDLKAQKRTVSGKKVKNIRKDGLVPGHIFGHNIESSNVQSNSREFVKVWHEAGETGIVNLDVEGKVEPVMIRSVAQHHITGAPLHVDFYKVNMSEKVTVNVPLEIVGEAPAVEQKVGLLLTPVTEIEVEALPTDLPESIQVDVAILANVGDAIKVSDLKIDTSKIEVKSDTELVVANIGELVTKEMEEAEAELEAATEAAAETQEGEEAVEGAAEEGSTDKAGSEAPAEDGDATEAPQEEKNS